MLSFVIAFADTSHASTGPLIPMRTISVSIYLSYTCLPYHFTTFHCIDRALIISNVDFATRSKDVKVSESFQTTRENVGTAESKIDFLTFRLRFPVHATGCRVCQQKSSIDWFLPRISRTLPFDDNRSYPC